MRFRFPWLVLVLGLLPRSADAVPFTFEFVMPGWSASSGPVGTFATLRVTVDSGSLSPASQVYTFGSVTQVVVDTTPAGGTYQKVFAGPPSFGSLTTQFFVTAPVTATPLLDISALGDGVFLWSQPSGDQLLLDMDAFPGGDVLFLVISLPVFGSAKLSEDVTGRLVPEPATIALVLLGLSAVGLRVVRARARQGRTGEA